MKKKFVNLALAFILSTIVFIALCVLTGSSIVDAFMRVTDGWIFGVLFMTCFDAIKRAIDKEKYTKTYIAVCVLVTLNVIMFFLASCAKTPKMAIAELVMSLLFGGSAVIVPCIFNKLKDDRNVNTVDNVLEDKTLSEEELAVIRQAETIKEWQADWMKFRSKVLHMSSKEKQVKALEEHLAFKLVGDSIYNSLDIEKPLIMDNATGLAYTVIGAREKGADATAIVEAEVYIENLLK